MEQRYTGSGGGYKRGRSGVAPHRSQPYGASCFTPHSVDVVPHLNRVLAPGTALYYSESVVLCGHWMFAILSLDKVVRLLRGVQVGDGRDLPLYIFTLPFEALIFFLFLVSICSLDCVHL